MRIAVIGGGIGGAAATRALLRQHFDVHLFEQARALTEVGAGVAVAPNGVRLLRRFGCGDAVDRVGGRWTDNSVCRSDGHFVSPFLFPRDDGRPHEYYGLHRADLLDMLLDGIPADRLHPAHRCVDFQQDADRATVRFENGSEATVDVVVAADGLHSGLQSHVVAPATPVHSGMSAYRGILTSACVDWPAETARLWMGEGKHFLVYPVRGSQLINYVGFVPTTARQRESWSMPGDPRDLEEAFAGWDPLVGTIIEQIASTLTWGLYDREPLPCWTSGRLALLGDAAHPMLPHQGQGANQAIEDAAALAMVLARRPDDPVAALTTYERVRRARTGRVQQVSRRSGAVWDGQSGADHDRAVAEQVEAMRWIFAYDAEAEAEAAVADDAVADDAVADDAVADDGC